MKIPVSNHQYFLEVHQQKSALPILLLLHGFMGSGRQFSHLIESLKTCCNPITLDLLGHGKSGGNSNPEEYREETQIEDLYNIISKAGLEPFFLHGYSMGGRLALRFTLAHPELPEGLILESTTFGLGGKKRSARMKIDEERAKRIENDYQSFLNDWSQMPLFNIPNQYENNRINETVLKEIQQSQNPDWLAASLRGFGSGQMKSVKPVLNTITCPVLLLYGEHDRKYWTIHQEMDHMIPNSQLKILKNAGHRVHIDQAGAWAENIKKFITQNS